MMKNKTVFTSRELMLDFRLFRYERDSWEFYKHLNPVRLGFHDLIVRQIDRDINDRGYWCYDE